MKIKIFNSDDIQNYGMVGNGKILPESLNFQKFNSMVGSCKTLGGVAVIDAAKILQIISEGGGTPAIVPYNL